MRVETFDDGHAVLGDSTTEVVVDAVKQLTGAVPLVVADPPYGNVLPDGWDKTDADAATFARWMLGWTKEWSGLLLDGGSMYVWGGIGRPGFRPFFRYVVGVEDAIDTLGLSMANLITWKKRRGYGKRNDYLFTREECAWFVRGDPKKPRCFNIPLLDQKRGYAGYDAKYPAKSEFLRRSNVWVEPELLRGKVFSAQKADRVIEVPIEVHTQPGEWVIDPFAGSGTPALAARRLGRRFVVVEKDEATFELMVGRLRSV